MSKKETKSDIAALAKVRNRKLKKANKYYEKMRKLEAEAEDLDYKISDTCDHPKEYLKLKHFSDDTPQRTFCYAQFVFKA